MGATKPQIIVAIGAGVSRSPIGIIKQNNFDPSLFTDFTGGLATNNGSLIDFSGGSTSGTKYYQLNNMYTSLEQWKITSEWSINTVNGTSYGLAVGILSAKANVLNESAMHSIFTDTPDLGINEMRSHFDAVARLSGIVSGTIIRAIIERDFDNFYITGSRIVGGVVVATVTGTMPATDFYTTTSPSKNLPSTSRLVFMPYGGITQLTSYKWESQYLNHPKTLVLGDSKVQGALAGARVNTMCYILGMTNSGSAGDRTDQSLLKMSEIISFIKPSKVIIESGRNDFIGNPSGGSYAANLTSMYNTLTTAGIDVWMLLPPPELVLNLTTLNNYMLANWPTKCIAVPPSWNATTDNAADGIHWNATGHGKIATQIQTNYPQLV